MKKLILLSLSSLVALGVTMSAASTVTMSDQPHQPRTSLSAKPAVSDPFDGIELTELQKARIQELFGAVKVSGLIDETSAQKFVAQIRKVLTPDQYMIYLENIATHTTSRMLSHKL